MERSPSVANNPSDVWRFSSYKSFMARYNELVQNVAKDCAIPVPCGVWDLAKVPGQMDTVASLQREYFDRVYSDLSMLVAFLDEYLDTKHDERTAMRDFIQANLRRSVFEKPESERDVQNAIESLLIGRGLSKGTDYDREGGRVKVSIKEVIPDFVLNRLSLAIEVKFSTSTSKSKQIVDEINADIQAYLKKYSTVLFVIYDMSTIRDEAEFKLGLETSEGDVQVVVVKH